MVLRTTERASSDVLVPGQYTKCGDDVAQDFLFEKGYRNLNHGSFGSFPSQIRDVLRKYQDDCECNPDRFFRFEYAEALRESRKILANYLNAPMESCVFLPNATTGINTVLRNLVYIPNDVILYFSTIYGSCELTVKYIVETTPADSHAINYVYPISDNDLCSAFEKAIKNLKASGKKPKVAIFDTIVSLPGVRVPFERLIELCRASGVLSCIDGAHSVGQIPIDLSALDPDFFVSNCHKWFHVPRGCAVFYVPTRNQALIRSSLPTSHYFVPHDSDDLPKPVFEPNPDSSFVKQFGFVGTLDSTPYLCIPAAMQWRSKLKYDDKTGETAIYAYCHQLAREGAQKAAEILGTEVMENAERTLGECAMSNVRLPLSYAEDATGDLSTGIKIAQWIARIQLLEYHAYTAVYIHADALWVRLSAQVYLTLDDFVWTATALRDICDRARKGEWRAALQNQ